MTPLSSLTDLRRQLKALGFGIKVISLSFGRSGQFVRLSDKRPLPDLFFGEADQTPWFPLIEFVQAHQAEINTIAKAEGISGLKLGA